MSEDKQICAKCGGFCCKSYPGAYAPADLGKTRRGVLRALRAGLVAGTMQIDWWEGDPRPGMDEWGQCYFVRPSIVRERRIFSPSWGGKCSLLTPSGCSLAYPKRPTVCRALVPEPSGYCAGMSKSEQAMMWVGYQDQILRIGKEVA